MNSEFLRLALGQTVPVGTLYDARTDSFLRRSLVKEEIPPSVISRNVEPAKFTDSGYQDGFNDKFSRLKIGYGLGASILSDFVPLDGVGRYFCRRPEDPPQLQAAIYHTIVTVRDRLELTSLELKGNLALSSLDTNEATHVLVEIEYGAQTVIVASKWLRPDEDQDAIELQFKADIKDFVCSFQNQQSLTSSRSTDSFERLAVYGTISGNTELILDGLEEARTYLELLPTEMRTQGTGEGTPIMYRLMPVKMLELVGLLRVTGSEVTTAASPECLKKIFDVFDGFQHCRKTIQSHEKLLSRYTKYVDPAALHSLSRRTRYLESAESKLRNELGQMLKDIRTGMCDPGDLWQLLQKTIDGEFAPKMLASTVQINPEKINFIEKMVREGATYIGHETPDLPKTLRQGSQQNAYVLFFSEATMQDQAVWNANQDVFTRLMQDSQGSSFTAIVDCDAINHALPKAVVAQFEDGQQVLEDLLEEEQYFSQQCYARCPSSNREIKDIKRPLDRRFVKINCPGRNCAKDNVCDWRCPECDGPLEYGFSDQYIYCECGRALYDAYEFKCNAECHGQSYKSYDKSDLLACLNSLDQSNYLNILILGETGVGKSTFINAFVNYLYFESLDDALQHEGLQWIIPCSFATQTMDRSSPGSAIIENKIKVGTREDEHDGSTGQSATQSTQVYPITVGSWTYRLIDTPGIGDTRGLEFDKQNMIDILATVSGYDYLHGIIILLKSNNARLTIHFAFCVKELLTHLHRDATRNVVFGFTNTRISNYMPGDTYGSLKALLNERPDIGLSLASNSVYCFDSESFRYLAAAKNGVNMENKKDFESSWERSGDEAHRMLDYFKTKEPHSVKSTTSLNGTRNLIKELTKPMAEISGLIRTNIDLTEDQVRQLQDAKLTGDQLKTKLHPEKTCIKKVDLDKPRTVCSDADCVEYRDDGTGNGTMLPDYPNPCHSVCYLDNVKPDVFQDPALLRCWAFSGEEDCHQCGHNWTVHLHFLYELETYKTTIEDLGIKQQLKEHASDLELKKAAVENRKALIEEYRLEHVAIQLAAAKFGLFMKENSILPYNDATVAYLDVLIDAEQAKIDAGGGDKHKNTLKALHDDKKRHLEIVGVLENSMQARGASKAIDQHEVDQIVTQLYNLKYFGQELENLKTDISGSLARTNRENPHRVRARQGARRKGHGSGHHRSSHNHGHNQNTLLKRQSVSRPGFSAGTMRPHQQPQVVTIRPSGMPGSFDSGLSGREFPPVPNKPPVPKKSWALSSLFRA
ncbi:MAG: hypothetical protein Q9160_008458 [Pyrenula sp. 1 TL-2023]